ncbi:amidase [Mycobacterium sp. smrl_JER01]|uniref:amidase n=1 Tax=Mycobacterium sp. smrl_JER01 TaxID=3402633 RepID=UPI003AD3A275
MSLSSLSATEMARGFRDRRFTPSEVTESVLATIAAVDPTINAYVTVDHDAAREAAAAATSRFDTDTAIGLLDGIPVSIKDVVLTSRWPTRRGSAAFAPAEPTGVDAPVSAALARSGAVVVGKTTTPELGWKAVTDSPLDGITRNPWDSDLTPGGSSGGASAAVATGMAPIAIGSDGGGSIRIPAAFTGVVGLKPTRGRVPLWPASPFGLLSHVGPLARTVPDIALSMNIVGGPDHRDMSFDHRTHGTMAPIVKAAEIADLRVGYLIDHPDLATASEVRTAVSGALAAFEDAGARLAELRLPLSGLSEVFTTLWYVGAAAATESGASLERLDPGLRRIVDIGQRTTAVEYHRAILARESFIRAMNETFEDYDVVITPTVPILPFAVQRDVPDGWYSEDWATWTPFTWPFNITGGPAISVPCAVADGTLPVGLQIAGPYARDSTVISVAAAFEELRGEVHYPLVSPGTVGR